MLLKISKSLESISIDKIPILLGKLYFLRLKLLQTGLKKFYPFQIMNNDELILVK